MTINKNWPVKFFDSKSFLDLSKFLEEERALYTVYPTVGKVFTALEMTSLKQTKVVIVGQDPYHGVGQAHGLSFSVESGRPPPSLKNIEKELISDIKKPLDSYNLSYWAEQGVLMLNSVLTVRENSPNSHKNRGWEILTDEIISLCAKENKAFILWGKFAQEKEKLIGSNCFVIKSNHPSPFSAHSGFFGSKPFSKINDYLNKTNQDTINW